MKLTLAQRQPETHDVESFFWKPEQPVNFQPGQYMRWIIRHDKPDERGIAHFFSISASPTESLLRLTTKFNPKGSTFKKALGALQIDAEIEAFGPLGSFLLPQDVAIPIVLVAGGIGITPFRSMLKYLTDTREDRQVHLIYAARSDQDIAFQVELAQWVETNKNWELSYALSQSSHKVTSKADKLTGDVIVGLTKNLDHPLYYLSGPEPMVKSLAEQVHTAGINEDHIKTDYFPGYTEH